MSTNNNHGLFYAIAAYTIWGIVPIYWKQLAYIDSFEIAVHRLVWSCVLVWLFIVLAKQWRSLAPLLKEKQTIIRLFLASVLIAGNSAIFIWAINANYIVEVSMGYFINPLIQVLFGVLFFKERLRGIQWLSIALATIGVIYLIIALGHIPLVALSLAFSFAFYGVIKKTLSIPAAHGMAIETACLLIPAVAYLFYIDTQGDGQFGRVLSTDVLLIIGGFFTLAPLMLFSAAAKLISMTALGMTQYIGPSLQLITAIFLYNEPFAGAQAVSFVLIWSALIIFTLDQIKYSRARRRASL